MTVKEDAIIELIKSIKTEDDLKAKIMKQIQSYEDELLVLSDDGGSSLATSVSYNSPQIREMPVSRNHSQNDLSDVIMEMDKMKVRYKTEIREAIKELWEKIYMIIRVEKVFGRFSTSESEYYYAILTKSREDCRNAFQKGSATIKKEREHIMRLLTEELNKNTK